ncbi:LuxR family transcriptional regulator [Actinomadura sp. KC216]|uniref:ATP-binding protein n=1 Tax=Actinomadura sp. KC216 TaxID=2530370 RepID=UPI001047A227|nr:LuxR family transcriptional regulator [Actinomadura sp. KC216]TDB76386.1 LuxR family transcriptional regulator [Actinomadura sp. KC216]
MNPPLIRTPAAPVLIGRSGELHSLLEAVTHPPAVALVEGEAGIGKTRLINEALRHPSARGRRVLSGNCHPLREPFPYGPVFELLRHLAGDQAAFSGNRTAPAGGRGAGLSPVCGALRPYLPELTDRLPPAPDPLQDVRAREHRLFRAVRALLDALGDTVMVVEDLHWADDGTRDLLRFLVDDPPAGLSAVLSYRREDLPGARLPLGRAYRPPAGTIAAFLSLEPLDVQGVRGMFTAITGVSEITTSLADELHRRTAGIPFVVEEVVRALPGGPRGRDAAAADGGVLGGEVLDGLEVPALLQDAIADRMSLLSPAAADAVRAASVLRVPAGEALIGAVAGGGEPGEDAPSAVREALLAGVLHEWGQDRYGFRHTLAQQAVYSALPGPDRRLLHRRAMRAMQALGNDETPPLVQLAYHAREAGMVAEWQRHAEAAVAAAREMGDLAVAVELLEELLSDARLGRAERARIAVELSRDAVLGLTHRRAVELLSTVVRDEHVPDAVRGEIRLNVGLLLRNQIGDYEAGRICIEAAVEELRDRPALAARGMAALAMTIWDDQPYDVCRRWIERAENLVAEVSDPCDPAVRTAVRGNHLALLMSAGDSAVWAQAEALIGGAGADTDRDTDPGADLDADRRQIARACGNFADAATWLGHYARAQRFRAEGGRLAAECGAAFYEGIVDGTALRLDWYTGRWDGLAERARRTLEAVHGVSGIASDAHLVLGLLASAVGDWDTAAEELNAAGLADPGNAPVTVLAAASGAMTRLRIARGDLDEGRAEAERGIARLRRKGIWVWAGDLVPVAVAALVRGGSPAEAERLTEEFAEGVAGRDAPMTAAALPACRGVLALGRGRPEEAIEAFAAAHAAYAALPQPYEAARAAEAAARCRMTAGDDGGARDLAALAEEFAALGALRDAARCRRVLRGHGVAVPSRRGRRGYGDQLSPRESEVARLVALGHTNRQIADALFLSTRTVEQHVAKVLRKLNVSSRAEVSRM